MFELKKTVLALSWVCAFQIASSAQSDFSPFIPYETFLTEDTSVLRSGSQGYEKGPPVPMEKGHFPLMIGSTSSEIRAYIENGGSSDRPFVKSYFQGVDYRFKTYSLTDNVNLLEAHYAYYIEDMNEVKSPRRVAAYILRNGVSIGMLALDNVSVFLPQQAPYYQAIRQLPRDRSPLRQGVPDITVKKVQFYQAPRTDQWIEKYALMNIQIPAQEMYDIYGFAKHTIMLQAFYPADVEPLLQDYIARNLSHNIEHAGVLAPGSTAIPLNQRIPTEQTPSDL